ncbi:ATP-grasp domain-containing protein [Actinophytocola sp. NPDC049390]|uniref:ATP-grasp domain-containing protein n=1 Tax=Actinophytocola sp. NPDC049390 TaxID=3363894 RepID=UPI0037B0FF3A
MSSRVLLFGGSRQTMRRAHDLGIEPLLLQRPTDHDESYRPLVAELRVVDYDDTAEVLAAARDLHRRLPFDRAVSVTEAGMLAAARVNELFGLGGNPVSSVRLLKDKARMRGLLNGLGLSPVAAAVVTGQDGIRRFGAEHGFPVIVKPVDASASVGVSRVDGPEDVASAWSVAEGLGLRRMLVEEYLSGPEISVEAFSFGPGRHHIVALTAKTTLPNFVEVGHVVPAPVPEDAVLAITGQVTALLNAVGHRDGPSHTELKLTSAGPRIVESHNRQGGDRITDLVELVHGVDVIKHGLAWATRKVEPWAAAPTARGAAAIHFMTPPPGAVGAITGVDEARAQPGVVGVYLDVAPGDTIREVRSSRDRAGSVVARAADAATATDLAARAAERIRFQQTSPDWSGLVRDAAAS